MSSDPPKPSNADNQEPRNNNTNNSPSSSSNNEEPIPTCSTSQEKPQNMMFPSNLNQFPTLSINDRNDSENSRPDSSRFVNNVPTVARSSPNTPAPSQIASALNATLNATPSSVYNWQATKTTVKDRFSFLFNNEVLADVHFIVGRDNLEQRIPAHKFVLSAGSAVFDAMFNGTLATRTNEIDLPDVEPAAFLALLKFLYSDEVQIGPETVMTTLYTAKKYAVPALEKHCVDFLKINLGSDNAFLLLTQARLFDEPQLAALCLEVIDKNTVDALAADGFTDIDLDTLNAVLERDTLRIGEPKLFQAIAR